MIRNLDQLNQLSINEIRKIFASTPLTETKLIFTGNFHPKKKFEQNLVAQAFPYIAKHVRSIEFRGRYIYPSSSYQELNPGSSILSGSDKTVYYYVTNIGDFMQGYIQALPPNIKEASLAFSTDDNFEQGYSNVVPILLNLLGLFPSTVTHLNLSGMTPHIHFDDLAQVLKSIKESTLSLVIDKAILIPCTMLARKEIFESLHKKLDHLSLASCNFHRLSHSDFLALPNILPLNLKSLNLGFNELANQPHDDLNLFLQNLPPNLLSLLLAGNDLTSLGLENLIKLFLCIAKSVMHLDLSDNHFLFMEKDALKMVLHSLSQTIISLRLCEQDTRRLSVDAIIERFNACLPSHITTLSFSRCNLLGRPMLEFAKIIKNLPKAIQVLDFSDNNFAKFSQKELILLFSNIPPHIRKIKLSRNALSGVLSTEILSSLPSNIEIDISDNGFDTLPFMHLNHLMDALPDGLFHLGNNSRLHLKDNGNLMAIHHPNTLFKTHTKLRHQKEFSLLLQPLLQLMKQKELNFDFIKHLLPFIFKTTGHDTNRLVNKMRMVNTWMPLPLKKGEKNLTWFSEPTCLKAIDYCIHQAISNGEKTLDLSHCDLFRLSEEQLEEKLKTIPKCFTFVKIKSNCFINNQMKGETDLRWVSDLECIEAIDYRIQQAISSGEPILDLSRCGLYRMSGEQLVKKLKTISKAFSFLKLKANGFGHSQSSRNNLLITLNGLPEQLKGVDISENDIENLKPDKLSEFLHHCPKNLLISLINEKPMSIENQINRRNSSDYYQELIQGTSCPLQQALIIFDDYNRQNGSLVKQIVFGLQRKHISEVTRLADLISFGLITNIVDLLAEVETIPKNDAEGWMFLFQKSKEHANKVGCAKEEEQKFDATL